MSGRKDGRVVTFYSFIGGSGRTMALANLAWILAANAKRVLVVDWDLESPGLHRFFRPFLDRGRFDAHAGVVDMIRRAEREMSTGSAPTPARLEDYVVELEWPHFPSGGGIDVISAGRRDSTYASSLNALDWDGFYANGGGPYLDALRTDMRTAYDYTLIDSSPGLGDGADICTGHLPDVLIDGFTFTEKAIEGAARIVASVREGRRSVRVLPIPMRVDGADGKRVGAGRAAARDRLPGLPDTMTDDERDAYWRHVEVPYRSAYAYEEVLATFGDLPGTAGSLLSAYEQIAWYLTGGEVRALPAVGETLRYRTAAQFYRRTTALESRVFLRYQPEDLVWAKWITEVLRSVGVGVTGDDVSRHSATAARELMIISAGRSAREAARWPIDTIDSRPPLGIYVDEVPAVPAFAERNSVVLHGLTEADAAARLLGLVGHSERTHPIGAPRYPGRPPALVGVPVADDTFTGREQLLVSMHQQLGRTDGATPRQHVPVALQGLGGVGKSRTVVEYIRHFGSAYDLVCWVRGSDLDGDFARLAEALDLQPHQGSPRETVRAVSTALRRGVPFQRWLIVFDDVEDYHQIAEHLPQGDGEVLITTRNHSWNERVTSLPVDAFDSVESTIHLQTAVPGLRTDEAVAIAEALGGLPAAVAEAARLLTRTGAPAGSLPDLLDEQGPALLGVERIWADSLERLRAAPTGAYRLLQLFSVLGPQIALALIYSDETAAALRPYDRSVVDRYVRGALVQQINRLGLLTLDLAGGRIKVHPLVQRVVRDGMSAEDLRETRHQAHLVLARLGSNQDVDDPRSWPTFATVWPHLEVSRAADCQDESARKLMIDQVRFLRHKGLLSEGVAFAQATEEMWTRLLETVPAEDERRSLRRQMLYLRHNLAQILRIQGRLLDAYQLDQELLRSQSDLLGPYDAHTLMTSNALAADLRALGRYTEALALDVTTYATWEERFGAEYAETLTARNSLATSYRLVGDYRAARDHDTAVHRLRSTPANAGTHPAALRSAAQLGRDLRDAGDYQRSVDLLRDVSRGFGEAFGQSSRLAASAAANLAVSLRAAGHPDQAAPIFAGSYEQLNETSGPTNPATLACRHSWGLNLLAVGQVDRSWAELQVVRDVYVDRLGPRHPHTGVAAAGLAMITRATGDRRTALAQAGSACDDLTTALGARHPHTLAAAMNKAVLMAECGDRAAALALMDEVLGHLRAVLEPEHPDTIRAEANIALITGEDVDAVTMRLAARIGVAHPTVAALRDQRLLHRLPDPH